MGVDLAAVWERPDVRAALARHDMGAVFRAVAAAGLTQREIADRTGQNQSDVSAIVHGREVQSYDLLERIAVGLGIPRGYMGLAYSPGCGPRSPDEEEDEDVKRRRFLAHAGQVVLGVAVFGEPAEVSLRQVEATPLPQRVGISDVQQLDDAVRRMFVLERHHGGGVVLHLAEGLADWSHQLLHAQTSDAVRHALLGAVARLHGKVAWAAYDLGIPDKARHHLLVGLRLAREADDPGVQAYLLNTAARVEMHNGSPDTALQLLHFGYTPALATRSSLLIALMECKIAGAYAKLGAREPAVRALATARESFDRAADEEKPSWLGSFFTRASLAGAEGVAWASLGEEESAINSLTTAVRARGDNSPLAQSFELAELGAAHLRNGDVHEGIRIGMKALDLVGPLRSQRARDRLVPLHKAAMRSGRQAADLAHRVTLARTT
ncbi:hypothetical protein LX15_005512 [Streptoalloteichus tenebrarius]|uniref:HTH cro/C1-type domain-containing protein n=1 Tax=Streptoalloteichus tenebrarius (strain ATCC 17920 / DSM 40477 / JCM 4838 / CBS 697.72 / NBRC 16177 / NCIMB 11028 / NRRL B-12390 / A12253. 1 / ISP 5477) TaxID=1933 RepID=A0ABT1I2I9_STRSD|nr:helix-turn-helix transcriptional regulator [Streptoalloteichus tenebrarius]MCP2261785.1 hypothetical protein [Streptoalloteichus tenebrarius]BFF02157.1 helix-turn-helix transcriptional regulator [Streptoalloteichus tenebrarius]